MPKFKPGDRVRIVQATCSHGSDIESEHQRRVGDRGTVYKVLVPGEDTSIKANFYGGGAEPSAYMCSDYFELDPVPLTEFEARVRSYIERELSL